MATAETLRGPISERYRPQRLDDVVASPRLRAELRRWADGWNQEGLPARRALVLAGPPGVGKTTTAIALALEYGWSLVEMNASDARNEAAIDRVAGRASITHTLIESTVGAAHSRALILLDEADCLTGRRTETARAAPKPVTLREFLRGRYSTLEALNQAWGLGASGRPPAFESWADLPRSAGRAAWTKLSAAERDLGDWKGDSKPADLSDRGGLGAISRLVRTTRQPLVLTVNDESVLTRYSPLFRNGVVRIRFSPVPDPDVARLLTRIAVREKIALDPGAVPAIVRKARGDLRAALNDLEAIAPLPPGPGQLTVLGVRDLTSDLTMLTEEALTAHRFYRSIEVQDRIDAPPDDLLPWVEENIVTFAPDARHRDAAFRVLASADLLLQRARRARVWSLWSYGSELLTGGVGLAIRDDTVPLREGARFPEFLGEMGRSRASRGFRDAIALKAAHRLHLSKSKTRWIMLPFLEDLAWSGAQPKAREDLRETARSLARELDLSPEETAYLIRSEPESKGVEALLHEDTLPPARTKESSRSPGPTEEEAETGSSPSE
ncbi:MAG: AAA family ATPase, partial [Thermoplasmata archaeon]